MSISRNCNRAHGDASLPDLLERAVVTLVPAAAHGHVANVGLASRVRLAAFAIRVADWAVAVVRPEVHGAGARVRADRAVLTMLVCARVGRVLIDLVVVPGGAGHALAKVQRCSKETPAEPNIMFGAIQSPFRGCRVRVDNARGPECVLITHVPMWRRALRCTDQSLARVLLDQDDDFCDEFVAARGRSAGP